MGSLDQKSREKVALAVFGVLVVFTVVAVVLYLNVGHSWNVAATSLDDTFGNMEGYTVILYEGTLDPDEEDEGKASEDEADAAKDSDLGSSFPDAASSLSRSLDEPDPVSVEEVEESYEEKGAEVLCLDVEDPSIYEGGLILQSGSQRFGVFSVDMYSLEHDIEDQVEYFEDYEVDFVVVITPDANLVDGIEGIDIAISTADEGLVSVGQTYAGTFFVDAVELDKVGVIAISPSDVASAKAIDEL